MSKALGNKSCNNIQGADICELEFSYHMNNMDETELTKPSLLLHSCCGPCSTSVVERLINDYKITIFFYNPNITDREEYVRRRDAQIHFIDQFNDEKQNEFKVAFKEGYYNPEEFEKLSVGMENNPEGGKRCSYCFNLRLDKTAETASFLGYDIFGTTLTVSPHKDFDQISDIGLKLSVKYGLEFLNENFKKKDGYKRSIELSKKYQIYRQNYCGCNFSK